MQAGFWNKKNSGTVNPAKLAWGLKRAAIAVRVKIYEECPMKRIDDEGAYVTVVTRDGEIKTPKVLPPLMRLPRDTKKFARGLPWYGIGL